MNTQTSTRSLVLIESFSLSADAVPAVLYGSRDVLRSRKRILMSMRMRKVDGGAGLLV